MLRHAYDEGRRAALTRFKVAFPGTSSAAPGIGASPRMTTGAAPSAPSLSTLPALGKGLGGSPAGLSGGGGQFGGGGASGRW